MRSLFLFLSAYRSPRLPIYLFIDLALSMGLFIDISIHRSLYFSMYLVIDRPTYRSLYVCIDSSVYRYIYLSISPPCLSLFSPFSLCIPALYLSAPLGTVSLGPALARRPTLVRSKSLVTTSSRSSAARPVPH